MSPVTGLNAGLAMRRRVLQIPFPNLASLGIREVAERSCREVAGRDERGADAAVHAETEGKCAYGVGETRRR